MYKRNKPVKTDIRINKSVEGETIEQKVNRIVNNNEPITDGAPIVYTERKDGVKPEYNIRTDRWEIANEAMDYVSKTHLSKRKEALKTLNKDAEGEPAQGQAGSGEKPSQTN